MITILIIILILAIVFGAWGYPQYGARSVGPLGLILIILLIAWLLGYLR